MIPKVVVDRPALGVYLHWPYCARICPYCDFAVVRDRGRGAEQARLIDAMEKDLRAQASTVPDRRLVSIFFGGGTPSLMRPEDAERLIGVCRSLWSWDDQLEITLEANPTDVETDRLTAFRAAGVNRLSLGVQALDDESLTFLGRNHSGSDARRAARLAARVFPRLSLDLIYALPGQTAQAWADTVREAVDLGCEHLSPYELTIEAGTAFDRAVRRGRLTPLAADAAAALYETTHEILSSLGFEAYEVSNHARGLPARCRHNLLYWRGEDYLGVGPSAHGRLNVQGAWRATETPSTPGAYIAQVEAVGDGAWVRETLDQRSRAEERLVMGLRLLDGVAAKDLAPLSLARLPDLIEAGLIRQADQRLLATAAGRMVLNRVTQMLAE